MISVKNHHITAIVRVDIDLEREDLEIKISCQILWGKLLVRNQADSCSKPKGLDCDSDCLLRKNITALPKEGADAEPEGVRDRPDLPSARVSNTV